MPTVRGGYEVQLGQIIRYWAGSNSDIPQHFIFLGGETREGWRFADVTGGVFYLTEKGLRELGEVIDNARQRRREFAYILDEDAGMDESFMRRRYPDMVRPEGYKVDPDRPPARQLGR